MKIIGITGGIGSGKSRVLSYMEEAYGAFVCQTDRAAHMLQEPGQDCYDRIVAAFGAEILGENRKINREILGNIVFSDSEKLERLNQIVHPAVKEFVKSEIKRAEEDGYELFLLESALLKEDHYEEICDELWFIYADRETRLHRLLASRGTNREKFLHIVSAQADEETFRSYCHRTIDNSGDFLCTIKQIEQAAGRR